MKHTITMRLDEKQLERDRRSPYSRGQVFDVYFYESELQFDSIRFEYEAWVSIGSPNVITVTIEPGEPVDEEPVQIESNQNRTGPLTNGYLTPKEIRGI